VRPQRRDHPLDVHRRHPPELRGGATAAARAGAVDDDA
jgi:hypothetical protein